MPPRGSRKLPAWMRPRSRWERLFIYRMRRERYFRSLAAAVSPSTPPPPPPPPPPPSQYVISKSVKDALAKIVLRPPSSTITIADLPVEILVRIFWFVLSANNKEYNIALPRVCSRWTRAMYNFVYVQGFGVRDYSDLLGRQLSLFADTLATSDYNAVLPEVVCRNVLGRYRLGMHPRVLAYTILQAEPKEGCVHSAHAVRGTQRFCSNTYGVLFGELREESRINLMISLFVLEYTQHVFDSLRLRLQTVLETKFIRRLDVTHLIDSERSILTRSTVWHDFARDIKDALETVHEIIDERLACAYSGVELSPRMRKRIIYLFKTIELATYDILD